MAKSDPSVGKSPNVESPVPSGVPEGLVRLALVIAVPGPAMAFAIAVALALPTDACASGAAIHRPIGTNVTTTAQRNTARPMARLCLLPFFTGENLRVGPAQAGVRGR